MEVISRDNIDIVKAIVPYVNKGKIEKVLIVETVVPQEITEAVERIKNAHIEYNNLREFKWPVKANYLILLGFFTILVVFIALWIALSISRNITEPIDSLVQATSKISLGNLDVYVERSLDDEIGMLINSFNKMVKRIKDAEISLHNAYVVSDRRRLVLENIIENINAGVIYLDVNGRVVTINNAACNIINATADDLLNKTYIEIVSKLDSPQLNKFINDINSSSFHSKKEQLKLSINGKNMVIRLFIIQLTDTLKNPIGMLIVFDDLTDLIQAEKALVWQDVAKRITHEIKNPLTPIKLSAERLLKRWQSSDDNFGKIIEKSTSTIIREVDGLKRLVDEFSRLGKMPDIELRLSNLRNLITEVVELYSDYDKINFVITYNTKIIESYIDPEYFKRVLINLIDNAIQATEDYGKIDIIVKEDTASNNLVVEICDNGMGIRTEDKEKLFQPYFSMRKNGTGLGLAISHKIITQHKGTITVRDNKPKGTIFSIEIPCY
ncbi:signal transduction histidine kinase involved in nitrogen fixation and metabolism regulation [Candidatus Magnetoovum chiemensis]|nr:signal transduction histidine kinase involved in nitrogen fixation and metabolism regulation [Candidatus Magnetoovum chiemensis]